MTELMRRIQPHHMVKLSVCANVGLAVIKTLAGIFSLSFFLCVNALYNVGIALAKGQILHGIRQEGEGTAQTEDHVRVGLILLISSAVYILYSACMFISPPTRQYPQIIAIAIAAFTFGEIALNLKGIFSSKKGKTPSTQVTKLVNLASALICLVLTQKALLSFASPGSNGIANGIAGMLFGFLAGLIGLYIILRADRIGGRRGIEARQS